MADSNRNDNSSQSSQSAAPSTGTDHRGEEDSILDGVETHRGTDEESSRQGAEAAEGMNAAGGQRSRTSEHKGSYGGEGGEPRTSSDQREPNDQR